MPIDYWDYLGWKDTLADSRFSARQRAYSRMRGDREVYTPQVVVNGSTHVIGSDRTGIESAIGKTDKGTGVMSVPVTMSLAGKQINVSVAASKEPTASHGEVWICSIAKSVPIAISRGENRGQQITYHNVVRNLLKVGDWNGRPESWTVPIENLTRDGVDGAVVYVQDGSREKPGADAGRGVHVAALIRIFVFRRQHSLSILMVRSARSRASGRCYASPREPCRPAEAARPRSFETPLRGSSG